MSGNLYNQLVDLGLGEETSDSPTFDSLFKERKDSSPFPTGTRVKYFTANLADDSLKLRLEHILTVSLTCQGQLKKPGDIVVLGESGTFDKDGCYNVMVKYLELVEAATDEQ